MTEETGIKQLGSDGHQAPGDASVPVPRPAFNDYATVHAIQGLFSSPELMPGGYGPVIASIVESHAARAQALEIELRDLQAKYLSLSVKEGKQTVELASLKESLTMSKVLVGGGSALAGGSIGVFTTSVGWGIAMLVVSVAFILAGSNPGLIGKATGEKYD